MSRAVAAVVHEAVRAYQQALGEDFAATWSDAPQWARTSTEAAVLAALDGSAPSPRSQHERWCAERLSAGWRYGPVRDDVAMVHPCLVDYDELPEAQRRKDALVVAVAVALGAPAAHR